MFVRLLLSVASLAVGLSGGALIECTGRWFDLFSSDQIGICALVEPLGWDSTLWLGVALVALTAISLVAIWVPVARRRKRDSLAPALTLQGNLQRLADPVVDEGPRVESGAAVLPLARVTRQVEALETALDNEGMATREVTEQWMGLLRETNELHNEGELATDDFKRINTRLLDLFVPAAAKDRLTTTSRPV